MNLDESQKKQVSAWIADGMKLAEIQKRLVSEFGVNLTYMEVRFLVDDLKLVPKDPAPPKAPVVPPAEPTLPATATPPTPATAGGLIGQEPPATAGGSVSVNVDAVTRPGALVSGSVLFSDGQTAAWYLDQMGRLGIAPKQQGYKPSAADLESFQRGLETELSKLGL
jgi:hypothetical protein